MKKNVNKYIYYYLLLSYLSHYIKNSLIMYILYIIPLYFMVLNIITKIGKKKITLFQLLIIIYGVLTILYRIMTLDIDSIINTLQLIIPIYFIMDSEYTIDIKQLNKIFILMILFSFIEYYIGTNNFGIFPFQSINVSRGWRISLFGTNGLAMTGAFSIIILITNLIENKNVIYKVIFSGIAIYFIILSASKTSIINLVFIALVWLFRRKLFGKLKIIAFMIPICVILSVLALSIYTNNNYIYIENNNIAEFLNVKNDKNVVFAGERYELWKAHMDIFRENFPFGVGDFSLNEYEKYSNIIAETESFFTFIIAKDGILSFIFIMSLISLLFYATKFKNIGVYIYLSTFIISIFYYGSYAVGYNPIFLLFISYISKYKTEYINTQYIRGGK